MSCGGCAASLQKAKGTGKPLQNDKQAMTANDVKPVIDGWASDLHQSYLKLKAQ